ncbi:MAG: xanthine dehydrogenase family protein molybdopterin-binding subunit [Devosia sp.]
MAPEGVAGLHAKVGEALPNRRAGRLVRGGGRFVANLQQRDALVARVVRSPIAHGHLRDVDGKAARKIPGVAAVFTAEDLAGVCSPWRALHALFPDARVPAEGPLAATRVRYVGEPVAIVLAETDAAAADGAEAVHVHIDPIAPVLDPDAAAAEGAPRLHDEAPDNLHAKLGRKLGEAPAGGEAIPLTLHLTRIAVQSMETRGLLAVWDGAEGTLTVHQSHQMQDIYARLLGIDEHKVRVVTPDVGGAFGMKQQLHPDEMAAVCAARILGRPVRLLIDRNESLIVDAQARDHRLTATAHVDQAERRVTGLTLRDRCGLGAFPHYPRTSFGESAQALRLAGAPYAFSHTDAEARLYFQNRPHLGHYRGVGHPIAVLATEALMDKAARRIGEDPITFRRKHLHDLTDGPVTTLSGIEIDRYRLSECLDVLEERLGPNAFDPDASGDIVRGVGVALVLEVCAANSRYYGEGEVNISTNESCIVRMEPSGVVRVATGNTDQGQGADQMAAQIVADVLGLQDNAITVISGDSEHCPYGGGAYGSRGTVLGGAAARDGALRLKALLLKAAGLLLQRQPDTLALSNGAVVDGASGEHLLDLAELSRACHFKPHLFPEEARTGLVAVGHHVPEADAQVVTAAFGAQVSLDRETGVVTPERLVVAMDGGTLINPAVVEAQLHGAVSQGLGHALLEPVRIDDEGQPLTGSYMDYTMPRADTMPLIEVINLAPLRGEDFAPRGIGEVGMSGTPAAFFNAVSAALAPFGATLDTLPATPERIWQALRTAAT